MRDLPIGSGTALIFFAHSLSLSLSLSLSRCVCVSHDHSLSPVCVRAHKFLLPPDRSASPPIISFRETITARGEAVEAATADRQVTLRVRAEPLGAALTEMVSDAIAVAIAAAAEMGDATTRGSGGSAAALRDGAFI